jgi:threonine 3-dehydrogenase
LIYVRDVLRAFTGLLAAPAARLSRRVYNIAGMTTTPQDIAAAIRRRLPEAVLDFEPDDTVDRVLASWPGAIDDSTARRDWQWRPEWDLARMADDFLAAVAADAEVAR